ncbi:MAG: prenyltransferase [Gemmatimonadetes bacterium]|nr:prenyltransferase [Gemmatimonadota bacterium]NNM05177.1 prenyltransferase [Gemmatimonadota bacterium]
MTDLKTYAAMARAPFLLLPVTLVVCGSGAAAYEGTAYLGPTLLALVGLVAVHIAVNALNEWSDMRRGIDLNTVRTPFSGGSGTLPAGKAPVGAALRLGFFFAAVGLIIGLWFLSRIGPAFLPFLLFGAVFVLGYTDALARLGVGEVAAGLGLGGLAVSGVAIVQEGLLGSVAIAASVPAFLMTFNLLLLNEFPDEKADREGGRKNLVLLLGRRGASVVYAVAALLVPLWIVGSVVAGTFPAWALMGALPSVLLAKPLMWVFGDPSADVPIPALGANVIWNLATNTLLGVGLFVGAALA